MGAPPGPSTDPPVGPISNPGASDQARRVKMTIRDYADMANGGAVLTFESPAAAATPAITVVPEGFQRILVHIVAQGVANGEPKVIATDPLGNVHLLAGCESIQTNSNLICAVLRRPVVIPAGWAVSALDDVGVGNVTLTVGYLDVVPA